MQPINDPVVVAEVTALHEQYEAALVGNDVETLTGFFWDSPLALRFGVGESLYGASEIEAFRKARSPIGLQREVLNLKVVTFGQDTASVTLEFRRKAGGLLRHGRQSQVWRKFAEGWKIVSAHVSFTPDSYLDHAAALAALPIAAEYRAGVQQNLELAAEIARPLLGFPLSPEIEAAPTFEP